MLDIALFREHPELVRESQRRRFANVEIVDKVINLDSQWRQTKYEIDSIRCEINKLSKEVGALRKSGYDATGLIQKIELKKRDCAQSESLLLNLADDLNSSLQSVQNLVHDTVVISNDEANNSVIRVYPTLSAPLGRLLPSAPLGRTLYNHVDLGELLGDVDTKRGPKIAGSRGFILKGSIAYLKRALIDFGLSFLKARGYTEIEPPYLMKTDVMTNCAQLLQFDEELYKVTGGGDAKYLIATAEQPLCAMHKDEWLLPMELPLRYAGNSTCFRKEAGSHGKDSLGIFRVHQFGKVEQFCITSPDDSWQMFEEMIGNSEAFYQALKIPYRVVSIVSGALNNAAAKKYELEGWFPASETYRELVSCSNCTDYQARRLEIRYGHKKINEETKKYVHLLNSTLTAAERTISCILENYQREGGVEIPVVLRPFMNGLSFMPFKVPLPAAKMRFNLTKCSNSEG